MIVSIAICSERKMKCSTYAHTDPIFLESPSLKLYLLDCMTVKSIRLAWNMRKGVM
jgi:hypothetical protein